MLQYAGIEASPEPAYCNRAATQDLKLAQHGARLHLAFLAP